VRRHRELVFELLNRTARPTSPVCSLAGIEALIQTLSDTMSAVPEPIFLLLMGFGMIALSMRVRARPRRKTVAKPVDVQTGNTQPLGKTAHA
jgi:hypothetical protein